MVPVLSMMSTTTLLTLLTIVSKIHQASGFFSSCNISSKPRSAAKKLFNANLPTSYEWLAKENQYDIDFFDLNLDDTLDILKLYENSSKKDLGLLKLPLLPLESVVFLPGAQYRDFSLNTPRNVQMVDDLKAGVYGSPQFCVVLQASDTGRMSKVGTIVNVIGLKELKADDGSVGGYIVRCLPQTLVNIAFVENPSDYSLEKRLIGSTDYLVAQVQENKVPLIGDDEEDNENTFEDVSKSIIENYNKVKSIYLDEDGVVYRDYPDLSVEEVKKILVDFKANLSEEASFWSAVEIWQQLSSLVKEAAKKKLQSDTLAISVEASLALYGKMKYPIDRSAFPQGVQDDLKRLEDEAANKFAKLGIEPILCFQALLSGSSQLKRLKLFQQLIDKELNRLNNA